MTLLVNTAMKIEDISLDAPRKAQDGKAVVTLEQYLGKTLKHPEGAWETVTANASSILRMLGIQVNPQDGLVKRAAAYLRADGYRAVSREKFFKVALVNVSACPVYIV